MLDIYKYGVVSRISPEAPVPIVRISHEDITAGGAANVAANLRELGCQVELAGYIGDDDVGHQLRIKLTQQGINHENLIQSITPTISKTRVLAGRQHMIRYDDDSTIDTPQHQESYEPILMRLLERLSKEQSFDVVIVSDYDKGTITNNVMGIIKSCFSCPIICDFKPINGPLFHNVFCVTPNLGEAKQLVVPYEHDTLFELITKIKQSLKVESVIITLSQDGICLLDQNNDFCILGAQTIVLGDITGAGDTVISTLAACLATGHSLVESVKLCNLAAAVVVRKIGTATCSIQELRNANLRM